jgi:hypothetical protein
MIDSREAVAVGQEGTLDGLARPVIGSDGGAVGDRLARNGEPPSAPHWLPPATHPGAATEKASK